jgi:hypothetical protein
MTFIYSGQAKRRKEDMAGQTFVQTQSKALDRVAALAKRLDVTDLAPDDRVGRWMIVTRAGQHYDVAGLVMALLDKIEASALSRSAP